MAWKSICCVLVCLNAISAHEFYNKTKDGLDRNNVVGYAGGIDVSRHQGLINWSKVKASGVSFAIAKATEGSIFIDPTFTLNYHGMLRNGIAGGAYHYLRGKSSVAGQVTNLLVVLKASGFNNIRDVLAIDVEQRGNEKASPDEMADTLYGMLEALKAGFPNIYIYTGPSYWETRVAWGKYDFSKYKLWIAHYTSGEPSIPTTWKNQGYSLWQFSERGSIGGISGFVDLDRTR